MIKLSIGNTYSDVTKNTKGSLASKSFSEQHRWTMFVYINGKPATNDFIKSVTYTC